MEQERDQLLEPPLVFAGRLTRDEVIRWGMYRIFHFHHKSRFISSLFVPVAALALLLLFFPQIARLRVMAIIGAAIIVGVLTRYLVTAVSLLLRAKDQDYDAKVIFDAGELTVVARDHSMSFPISAIHGAALRRGIEGRKGTEAIFFLPYRVMSASDRARLERILGL